MVYSFVLAHATDIWVVIRGYRSEIDYAYTNYHHNCSLDEPITCLQRFDPVGNTNRYNQGALVLINIRVVPVRDLSLCKPLIRAHHPRSTQNMTAETDVLIWCTVSALETLGFQNTYSSSWLLCPDCSRSSRGVGTSTLHCSKSAKQSCTLAAVTLGPIADPGADDCVSRSECLVW